MTMIRWKSGIAVIGALAAAVGLAATARAQAPETKLIRFVAVPSAGSSLVWIAAEKGFDKQEGIEIQIRRDLAAGLIADNIIGRNAEMVYGGAATMLFPYARGAPLKMIAVTDADSRWEVIVHPDSGFNSIADMKGKTVSVIAPNSMCVVALRRAFEIHGLPKDHMKFAAVAPPDQVAAFGARRVDGSCMFDPYRLQMMSQFGGKSIWSILDPRYNIGKSLGGSLIVHREFAEKNPNTVAAIQRAIDKAAKAALASPDLVYTTVARALKQDVEHLKKIALPRYLSPPTAPAELKEIADAIHQYGLIDKPIDIAGFTMFPK
jgi:NitT/TauT family transport system substrate-binding protein